ncbi:TPA: hypothetical protein HA278_07990 [Candidatus Woesearchaeota archaeon]|nr:hypothetical protein [Candidatus Woesearchaeota archaeon]
MVIQPSQETSTTLKLSIIQLKNEKPSLTLESIGEETGVSREYVRQVLKEAGIATNKVQPSCHECGTLLYPSKNRPYVDLNTGQRYCRICRHDMVWGTYSCHNCQKDVIRRKRDVLRATPKYIFCDKTCQGQYIGKHFGRKSGSGKFTTQPTSK